MDMRKRIFDIIQIGNREDIPSRTFDIVIVLTIFANILVLCLETFEGLSDYFTVFKGVEYATTGFFCFEYLLRIWTADYLYPDKSGVKARLAFLFSYDGIVDLLTIIPAFFLTGFVAFRILRVARIFHLFRLNAQSDSFNVITKVLYERRNQIASSLVIIAILMLASSLCIYSAEHEAQPGVFSNAFSGIWWSVSTVLTVGYGDIYPITTLGKCMAIVISFLGVGAVAIPTGIISAGFVEQYQNEKNAEKRPVNIKEIGEIEVDENHFLLGCKAGDTPELHGIEVIMIIRDNLNIIATENLEIKKGDILITRSNKFT